MHLWYLAETDKSAGKNFKTVKQKQWQRLQVNIGQVESDK